MENMLKIRIVREVESPTATGIQAERTLRFPVDKDTHRIEMGELVFLLRILKVSSDGQEGVVEADGRQIEVKKGELCYFGKRIEPRFLFFVYFEFEVADYQGRRIEGYSLSVRECLSIFTVYDTWEREGNGTLPAEVRSCLYLPRLKRMLTVSAIDEENKAVLLLVDSEEVEVRLDQPGRYQRSTQSGNGDSFEAVSETVDICLVKSQE